MSLSRGEVVLEGEREEEGEEGEEEGGGWSRRHVCFTGRRMSMTDAPFDDHRCRCRLDGLLHP